MGVDDSSGISYPGDSRPYSLPDRGGGLELLET